MKKVAQVFSTRKVFLTKKHHIVFVCGGSIQNGSTSVRSKFLTYAENNLKGLTVFVAEYAWIDLLSFSSPQFVNLSEFENLVSEISDCILIFPETDGAVAELGFILWEGGS